MYHKNEFEEIQGNLTKKTFVNYVLGVQSLINKLEQKGIEDRKLDEKFGIMADALKKHIEGDNKARRLASNSFAEIISHAEKHYNLVQKGALQGRYLAIFIGVGVALGSSLMTTVGTSFMGVGIAIGAGLGVAIGASIEKKAEEEDRLY